MYIKNIPKFCLLIVLIGTNSCQKFTFKPTLFTLQQNDKIGINFTNQLKDLKQTNVFTFRNYYNGGGVAICDLNNDGLNDVFLISNQGENKLYINKGNWKFEDVTEKANIKSTKYWSTGVTLVDINGDGWLDIYVCHSGNGPDATRGNELYINQHDGTFKEEAEKYGLSDKGLSTQAIFFDYDNDGDLDCFVLNNSFRPIESFDFTKNLREVTDKLGGARLYRNDNGHFTNVTKEAGIYSSDIGFGLGVSVVDINQDGYPDIYVSNDFFERDYLYINQKNGTFKEDIQNEMGHLSTASMGSDIADINNDGQYDVFTTEMLPEGDKRLKQMTSFENYDLKKLKAKDGYYNQYMQNCLQINNGNGTFAETAFYSGVAATDWSWGALMFDMDNDGWKDIFVSNGIYKDLTDQDYIEFLGNRDNMAIIAAGNKKFDFKDFTDKMKSSPQSNYAFLNNHNLTFTNKAEEYGLATPSFSNGAAYGDLDNDGDNDLVVNNVNMPVFVYKNNAEKNKNNFIQVKLEGLGLNKFGIGTTIKTFYKNQSQIYYNQPTRGFQSCTSPNLLTIGLGKYSVLDSVQIIWPGGKYELVRNLKTNKVYTFKQKDASLNFDYRPKPVKPLFTEASKQIFDKVPVHVEDDFIDFDYEKLMLQMLSTENPYMAKADVNNDGLTDFYFGGSKGNPSAIYMQQKDGKFIKSVPEDFEKQTYIEPAGAAFGDFNGDGHQELIVGIGGNAEEAGTPIYFPRFFENDGKGHFKRNPDKTIHAAVNASVITACDYDKDGHLDLFIGGRSIPGLYGSSPKSYVMHNDGTGHFTDVSKQVFGEDTKLGMVTAAKWADLDNDGYPDLIVAGNWMGIRIFKNYKGKFTEDKSLANYKGWWSSLEVADIDGDGKLDIVAGNLGLNSKFKASATEPMHIYIKDFDNNGTKECVTSMYKSDHIPYVFHMKPDLVGQLPILKKRFLKYQDYAGKPFNEVFTDDMLAGAEVHEINDLYSSVFFNKGKTFKRIQLPVDAQLSSINTIICDTIFNKKENAIITAGNFYGFKPEVGRLDANYGQVYVYKNGVFKSISQTNSGLNLRGQVNSSLLINNSKGKKYILFGVNDDALKVYQIVNVKKY